MERYLPYAAALDLTNDWSGQFAGTLDPTWTPGWYRSNSPFAADQLVKSLDSAIAATSERSSKKRQRRRRFIARLGGAQLQSGQ